MNIVVIEDELTARDQLVEHIRRCDAGHTVIQQLGSIKETAAYFNTAPAVDLIFSDIELSDGNIIAAWKDLDIHQPVIFVTAYDQYWQEALQRTGIDYILKPYAYPDIARALQKFLRLRTPAASAPLAPSLEALWQALQQNDRKRYKQRFTYKLKDKILLVETAQVSYFSITNGIIYAHDRSCKRHPLQEQTLQELEQELDPDVFFRINRSDIINVEEIDHMRSIEGERTEIFLKQRAEAVYTSANRNAAFRRWLESR
jgi:DNA-binding LytR/AlgR family response regulator